MRDDLLTVRGGAIDLRSGVLRRGGERVTLRGMELKLLRYLAGRPGRPVSRTELLAEVWGYRSGVSTRTLDTTVHRLRLAIEEDPAAPRHIQTVRGTGYRFQAVLAEHPGAAAVSPMPAARDRFFGRREALEAVRAWLAGDGALMTLTGPGGVGKTRLALEALQALRGPQSPEGVEIIRCQLAEARGWLGFAAALAAALGVSVRDCSSSTEAVARLELALAGRAPLLVQLDSPERSMQAARAALQSWLNRPGLRFLVSSQERLRLAGEAVLELSGLADEDAKALYRDRSGAGDAGEGEAELLAFLEGSPLAIELAAGWSSLLSPDKLLELVVVPGELRASRRDRPPRHRSLQAAAAWSHALLSPGQRELLATCALFRGGFTAAAAAAAWGRPLVPLTLGELQALVDRSMLHTGGDAPRLAMYASVRGFVEAGLNTPPGAGLRHARWYAEEGERRALKLHGPEGEAAMRWLRREVDNLLAATDRASSEAPDVAARALVALAVPLLTRGPALLLTERLDVLLATPERLEPALRGQVLKARGHAWLLTGDRARGMAALTASISDAREAGDRRTEAAAVGLLGFAAMLGQELDRARSLLEGALALRRALGDRAGVGAALGNLATLRHRQGDFVGASEQLEQALIELRAAGDELGEAQALVSLGSCRLKQARWDEARAVLERSAGLQDAWGEPLGAAVARVNQGAALIQLGRYREAGDALSLALDALARLGDRGGGIYARSYLAIARCFQGEHAAAAALAARAAAEGDALDMRYEPSVARLYLAAARAGQGLLEPALLDRAAQCFAEIGVPDLQAACEIARGHLDLARHRAGEAGALGEARRRLTLPGDGAGGALDHVELCRRLLTLRLAEVRA